MPAKNAKAVSGGFSAEERAAMKERAAELRAEGTKGAKKADGLQAVLDRIAEMAPEDRALAGRVHVTVTAAAPGSVAEDLVRDARLRERGRQGRRLLPERGQVQLPLLDPGLPGRGQPRRRRHVAGDVRAYEVEPHGGKEGRRPGEGRDLLTGAATAAQRPHRPRAQRLRAAPPQPRCHDLPCHSPAPRLAPSHGETTAPTQAPADVTRPHSGMSAHPRGRAMMNNHATRLGLAGVDGSDWNSSCARK